MDPKPDQMIFLLKMFQWHSIFLSKTNCITLTILSSLSKHWSYRNSFKEFLHGSSNLFNVLCIQCFLHYSWLSPLWVVIFKNSQILDDTSVLYNLFYFNWETVFLIHRLIFPWNSFSYPFWQFSLIIWLIIECLSPQNKNINPVRLLPLNRVYVTHSQHCFQLCEHKLRFWKASHQTDLPTESNDKHWIKCAFCNTHTHLDTKEKRRQKLEFEQQTHWQEKEMNGIYEIPMFITFLPEGSRIHLCEDQILDRADLFLVWGIRAKASGLWQHLQMGWGSGRHQGQKFLVAPWTTRTGLVQTAQLKRGEKGPSISAAATEHNLEFSSAKSSAC